MRGKRHVRTEEEVFFDATERNECKGLGHQCLDARRQRECGKSCRLHGKVHVAWLPSARVFGMENDQVHTSRRVRRLAT